MPTPTLVSTLCLLGSLTLPASHPQPEPAQPRPTPADTSPILQTILAKHDVPALGVVVIRGGEIVAQGAAGVRRRGSPEPVTPNDLWHLGSCTKAMTATLAALLVEDRTLAWDTTVLALFPEHNDRAAKAWADVTLERLVFQTAGAPANLHKDGLWARLWERSGTPTGQRLQLLGTVLTWKPDHTPGTKFAYSNTNYAIAGAMTERAAGKGWEELIQSRLFAPLNITSAGFGAPGTTRPDQPPDQPRGHAADGTPVEPGPDADNPAAIGPGGTVHMSLPDWGKFASLHLAGERRGWEGRLTPAAFKKLHTPLKDDYAGGWAVLSRPWAGPSQRALTHSGSNTMWFAVAWLAPDMDMAVLVACNQGGDPAAAACDAVAARMVADFIAPAKP